MALPAVPLTARGGPMRGALVGHMARRRSLVEWDVEPADCGRRFRGNLWQFLAQRRPPATVVEHGLQRPVDGRDALAVALFEAYSVDLVAEEDAGDLELAPVFWLFLEAGQDRVVGRDGLNLLAKQLVDTVAVAWKPDQVDL